MTEGLTERNDVSTGSLLKVAAHAFWNRISYRSKDWKFSSHRKTMISWELEEWKKYYLPIDLRALTVLDVGAGEGETAKFFLEHGAKNVICIEADPKCFANLRLNAQYHPILSVCRRFDLQDLKTLKFDFMKMDIEGYEEELLLTNHIYFPCIIEVHGMQLRDRFLKRGFLLAHPDPKGNPYEKYACFVHKNLQL